ncbi:MAG: hypothetical protein E2O78_09270 [Caldithrix sp.]|nr:MAG: hypothetical protein E2O78_09270 [Caldithrix sp.]
MKLDFPAFAFIMTLAAVINGMGIVRLLAGFAEYLKRQNNLEIVHYWVFNLWIAFQFLLHILIWWSLWNARAAETFTFLHYLYLLSGPFLAYLGASLLIPDINDKSVDMHKHFYGVRVPYFTVIAIFWLWVIFLFPVLTGRFAPTVPILVGNLAVALTLRFTANPKIHAASAIAVWLLLIIFVAVFAMQLGAVAEAVKLGA